MRNEIKKCPLYLFIPFLSIIFLEKSVDFIYNGLDYYSRANRLFIILILILSNVLLFFISVIYILK